MKKNELQALFVKAVEALDLKNPDHVKVLAGLTDVMRENGAVAPLNPSVEAVCPDHTLLGPGRLDITDKSHSLISASKDHPKYVATFEPNGQGKLFNTKPPKSRRMGPVEYYSKDMVVNALKSSTTMKEAAKKLDVAKKYMYALIRRHDLYNEASHLYERTVRHTKEEFASMVKVCTSIQEIANKCGYASVNSVYANLKRWNLKFPA